MVKTLGIHQDNPEYTVIAENCEHPQYPDKHGDLIRYKKTGVYCLKAGSQIWTVPWEWADKIANPPPVLPKPTESEEKGGE